MTDDPRAAAFEQALTDEVLFDAFCVVADVTPYWENVTSAAVVEMRSVLVAALLKAAPPAEGTWQPIETAPKDGPIWLVVDGRELGLTVSTHQVAGWWIDDRRYVTGGYWSLIDRDGVLRPTHWMPLPTPPRDPAGKE